MIYLALVRNDEERPTNQHVSMLFGETQFIVPILAFPIEAGTESVIADLVKKMIEVE